MRSLAFWYRSSRQVGIDSGCLSYSHFAIFLIVLLANILFSLISSNAAIGAILENQLRLIRIGEWLLPYKIGVAFGIQSKSAFVPSLVWCGFSDLTGKEEGRDFREHYRAVVKPLQSRYRAILKPL